MELHVPEDVEEVDGQVADPEHDDDGDEHLGGLASRHQLRLALRLRRVQPVLTCGGTEETNRKTQADEYVKETGRRHLT